MCIPGQPIKSRTTHTHTHTHTHTTLVCMHDSLPRFPPLALPPCLVFDAPTHPITPAIHLYTHPHTAMHTHTLFVALLATAVSAQKVILAVKPTLNAPASVTLDYVREAGREGRGDRQRKGRGREAMLGLRREGGWCMPRWSARVTRSLPPSPSACLVCLHVPQGHSPLRYPYPSPTQVDPPANIVLNTRDFPVKVAYANIPEGELVRA